MCKQSVSWMRSISGFWQQWKWAWRITSWYGSGLVGVVPESPDFGVNWVFACRSLCRWSPPLRPFTEGQQLAFWTIWHVFRWSFMRGAKSVSCLQLSEFACHYSLDFCPFFQLMVTVWPHLATTFWHCEHCARGGWSARLATRSAWARSRTFTLAPIRTQMCVFLQHGIAHAYPLTCAKGNDVRKNK